MNVETVFAGDFSTLAEAKRFCRGEIKGRAPLDAADNCHDGKGGVYCLDVFDGSPVVEFMDEDGEIDDARTIFRDPVYSTPLVYED